MPKDSESRGGGKITKHEKSLVSDIVGYVKDEYIIPKSNEVAHDMFAGITNMLADAAIGALDKLFYDNDRVSTSSSRNSKKTDYSGISEKNSNRGPKETVRSNKPYSRKVVVYSKDDADTVKKQMINYISKYGYTRVGDLYEAVGWDMDSIDWAWGWTEPTQITYRTRRNNGSTEYVFELPDPVSVKNL